MTACRATVRLYVAVTSLLSAGLAVLASALQLVVACLRTVTRAVESIGRAHVGSVALPAPTKTPPASVAEDMDRLHALEVESVRQGNLDAATYALRTMGFKASQVSEWVKRIPANAPAKKVDEWVREGLKALGS